MIHILCVHVLTESYNLPKNFNIFFCVRIYSTYVRNAWLRNSLKDFHTYDVHALYSLDARKSLNPLFILFFKIKWMKAWHLVLTFVYDCKFWLLTVCVWAVIIVYTWIKFTMKNAYHAVSLMYQLYMSLHCHMSVRLSQFF